jgi:acyl-CoA thioesterase I
VSIVLVSPRTRIIGKRFYVLLWQQMRAIIISLTTMLLAACGDRPAPPSASAPHDEPRPATATQPAGDDRRAIVAFGNSLTAGFGADTGKSYPDFLQREFDRRGLRYRIVNAGISGETTTDALARVDTVAALKPAIVILEFGANDGLRGLPIATTRSNLDQLVAVLRQSGAQVLLAGMTLPPNYGPDYIRSFQEIYTGISEQQHVPLIPFLLAGVAGTTRYMQGDGLHPTAEGNRLVAGTVMRYLEPMLPSATQTRRDATP